MAMVRLVGHAFVEEGRCAEVVSWTDYVTGVGREEGGGGGTGEKWFVC